MEIFKRRDADGPMYNISPKTKSRSCNCYMSFGRYEEKLCLYYFRGRWWKIDKKCMAVIRQRGSRNKYLLLR